MLIAQITDLHIKAPGRLSYRRVDAAAYLRRCIADVLARKQQPDIVVFTGDLADFGRREEYAHLRELLAPLPMPYYLLPGNHDERATLQASFPEHGYLRQMPGFVQYMIDDYPLRLIALDTTLPGQSGGELCARRLAWFEARLDEAPQRPTVVLMHHPPFTTGIGHMDRIGLADAAPFAAIVARHPNIERILCGHLHRPIQVRFHGTLASTCPGPAHQVALDLSPAAPSEFVMEPPGYQLHLWQHMTLISHTAYVGNFDGPYPFYEGGSLIDD